MNVYVKTTAEFVAPPVDITKHFAPQLRRADNFIKLGVAAADKVFTPDREQVDEKGAGTGLFLGTAFGPMQTNFDVLGLIVDENQTSPTLFSHSVFNSAAGYIARLLNISGSSFTFTDFSWPFFRALAEGYIALVSGRLENCLVLQVESYSDLLLDALQRTGTNSTTWPQGAVAWYLSTDITEAGWQLEQVKVSNTHSLPISYLQRREKLQSREESHICETPLAAAAAVTRLLKGATSDSELACELLAPYGSVSLTLHPVSL